MNHLNIFLHKTPSLVEPIETSLHLAAFHMYEIMLAETLATLDAPAHENNIQLGTIHFAMANLSLYLHIEHS